jgi:CRP-like cAMP-binding protein
MISPETLRRFPFFALLDSEQLKDLAMLAEEQKLEPDQTIFEQEQPAEKLYFVLEGCIDLYYTVQEAYRSDQRHEILVSEISPGEPFGISSLIEPHVLTATARACRCSRIIAFDRRELENLFTEDPALERILLQRVAKAAMERLGATRTQLAAAWA